jgi:selenocysteine-specific elongation factor
VGELQEEGELTKTEAGYSIPNWDSRHTSQWAELMAKVIEFANHQGHASFSVGALHKIHEASYSHREIEKAVNFLHARKKLVRLNDDRFIGAEAMQEIQEKVRQLILRKGKLAIHDSREVLGYGRTRAIAVFEYLDSIGLTCRVGDFRVLAEVDRLHKGAGHMGTRASQ